MLPGAEVFALGDHDVAHEKADLAIVLGYPSKDERAVLVTIRLEKMAMQPREEVIGDAESRFHWTVLNQCWTMANAVDAVSCSGRQPRIRSEI